MECLVRAQNALGECTLWCEREQALWWVDSRGPALYRHNLSLSETRSLALPETPYERAAEVLAVAQRIAASEKERLEKLR